MKARLEDKYKAIELRKSGLSYKEIQQTIPVSKGLLSGWFRYLDLSLEETKFLESRILERQNKGRIRAALSNRNRRVEREKINLKLSEKLFDQFKDEYIFIMGICLYWAEGGKRSGYFQFVNSDPEMIHFMYKWMQKYLSVDKGEIKCRLFTHKISGFEKHIGFWADLLNIHPDLFRKTIFKPTIHSVKKNPNYNGCFRMEITKIKYLRMMKNWQKLMMEYYGNFV